MPTENVVALHCGASELIICGQQDEDWQMYAVVVTFEIGPDDMAAFREAIVKNAAQSLAQEAGCQRFDVCFDPSRPNEVFLYELYEDAAAFGVHLDAAHFKEFDALIAEMDVRKDVRTYAEVVS